MSQSEIFSTGSASPIGHRGSPQLNSLKRMRYDSKIRLTTIESTPKEEGVGKAMDKLQSILEDWSQIKFGDTQINSPCNGSQLFNTSQTSSFDMKSINVSKQKGRKQTENPTSIIVDQPTNGKTLLDLKEESFEKSDEEESLHQNANIFEAKKDANINRESIRINEGAKTSRLQTAKASLRVITNEPRDSFKPDSRPSFANKSVQDDRPKTAQNFSGQISPLNATSGSSDLLKLDMILRSNAKKQLAKNQLKINNDSSLSPGANVAKVSLRTSFRTPISFSEKIPDISATILAKDAHLNDLKEKSIINKTKAVSNLKNKVPIQESKPKGSNKNRNEGQKKPENSDENCDMLNVISSDQKTPSKSDTKTKNILVANRKSVLDTKTTKASLLNPTSANLPFEQQQKDGIPKESCSLEKSNANEPSKKPTTKSSAKKLPYSPISKALLSKGSGYPNGLPLKNINSNDSVSTNESKASKPIEKVMRKGSNFSFSSQEESPNFVIPAAFDKPKNPNVVSPSILIETQNSPRSNELDDNVASDNNLDIVFTPNAKLTCQSKLTEPLFSSPKMTTEKKTKKEVSKPLPVKKELAAQPSKITENISANTNSSSNKTIAIKLASKNIKPDLSSENPTKKIGKISDRTNVKTTKQPQAKTPLSTAVDSHSMVNTVTSSNIAKRFNFPK